MPIDNAGNTLNTAKKITLTTNIQTFSDWVGSSDIDDFYSLSLAGRSSLNVLVDDLNANVNAQIIKDANSNGLIDSGEIITGSYQGGHRSELIKHTLNAGNYFIRVYSQSGDTNYNLKIFENFAPTSLEFNLNSTSLNTTDNLSINNAWVSDKNGVSDISKVDFRIQRADGTWLNVADATVFTADSSNASKANFSYSLSLKDLNLAAGNYTLQGKAYDQTGAVSNTVKQTFTVTTTAPITTSTTAPTTTSTTAPTTTSTLVQDWFSQNLLDQQIITLVRSLASDGDLSRQDMLNIFRNAQDNSAIDVKEVKDLKTLLGASTPFTMQDSVKWLSTQVANGATVDMAASNFESNLVGRWFLGTIAPTPVFNGTNLTYTVPTGSLFGSSGEARIGDIDQGKLGNCTFLAALGATFGRQFNDAGNTSSSLINSMITDNGDNTYTMRFYSNGAAEYVTVDRRIATSIAAKRNNGVLWVALVEKAYAQWLESRTSQPGYNVIGNGTNLFAPLQFVTGRSTTNYSISKVSFSTLETALANGQALTAARVGGDSKYIASNHAYSLTNTYIDTSGQQRVVVRNPWGVDGKTLNGTNDGFIDLSFAEFTQSFNYGISVA
ncbi:C2 family cysteine protease [Anabaena sp. UHCC 0399]|uniref:C2 family cysteine protease n=1 Tax=Anabaena sp. UHCC 0399 TaxID=3110238 RepID=UPI002B22185C|nr:C2 family cysteine protease [Anabaena sp. UHCC 0399]MEA5564018.1 C2 family cysteine protease [Anabaena sp. UHCC 0399]